MKGCVERKEEATQLGVIAFVPRKQPGIAIPRQQACGGLGLAMLPLTSACKYMVVVRCQQSLCQRLPCERRPLGAVLSAEVEPHRMWQ